MAYFANLYPSMLNFFLFCMYLVLAANFLKFVSARWDIPGIGPLMANI